MKDSKNDEAETDDEFVSLRELAEEWSTSRQTVRRALERAGIRPVYLCEARNGTLRYSRAEVQRYVARCRSM